AAIKCFATKGFHSTSIQDIVDEVGIAKGSLYIYFKSKDELLSASLDFVLSQIRHRIEQSVQSHVLTEHDRLSRLIAEHIDYSLEYKDYIMMLMSDSVIHLNTDIYTTIMALRSDTIRIINQCILDKYG